MADNGECELEAMPSHAFSWHPCNLSLCPSGLGLIVKYEDNDLEEKLTDKQDVLARIRVRSTPLLGDDCSSVQQGDHVLATQNPHVEALFFDARIEKAIRVKHSDTTHCKCSFTIKWLHQALEEGEVTVPATSIMKRATKSINHHPIISTFFSILGLSNGLRMSPCSVIDDSMNQEMDINILLEKQIEQISNSADVSEKKELVDFVFRLEVDPKEESLGREIDASLKDPYVPIPLLNYLEGSTGSENKHLSETIVEITPDSTPVQEEFTGSRLPLNPLAARAVLASLRSDFPLSTEVSIQSNMKKGYITGDSATKLTHGSESYSLSDDHPSSKVAGNSPNFNSIVKTLFPPSSARQIEYSNMSRGAQVDDIKTRSKISGKKIIQSSEPRLTRAQIQRNNEMQESNLMTNSKETQLKSTKTQRVKLETSVKNSVAQENCLSDNQKLAASPVDGHTPLKKDGCVIKVNSKKRALTGDAEKHNYPKKLTRSAAPEVTGKKNARPKLKGRKSYVSESNELDDENASSKSKKVKNTPNCAESGVGSKKGTRGKSAIPKKQETRSSPRLRFLPRTRSQRKA